jgi:hypothetical protein
MHLYNQSRKLPSAFVPQVVLVSANSATHSGQIALCDYSGPGVQAQFHFRNLLVYVLHKLNDKVDKFVLEHRLSVEVGDQERDIVALGYISLGPERTGY